MFECSVYISPDGQFKTNYGVRPELAASRVALRQLSSKQLVEPRFLSLIATFELLPRPINVLDALGGASMVA